MLVLGTVAVVAVVMNQSEDKKEERSFEREEDDSEFKMTVAKEEREETEDRLEEDAESIEKQENTEEKEEPEEEKTPLLNHEGEVVVMANNMDGTYTVKISEYVFFDRSYVERTDIGDEIISPMGDRFILITLQDLYAEYYGEDYTTGGYAAYSLGPEGQKYYYEMEVYGDGYRLLTPDSRAYILDGQQSDGVVVKVAEDAEIMLLGNAMESEAIAVEDFVTMNWNGTSGYGRMLPMPASAKIVDGELVFLSQIFVP